MKLTPGEEGEAALSAEIEEQDLDLDSASLCRDLDLDWDKKFNIPSNPADLMHIDFLKDVIKTQKEQIDELNNSLEMYRFLESGEEEHGSE